MAALNPTLTTPEQETRLGGRGPGGDGFCGGGGGDDNGSAGDFNERLRRCRIGLGVGLVSVLMLFIGFTSAYLVRQGLSSWSAAAGAYINDWQAPVLPPILWINTGLLLASSVTLEMARRRLALERTAGPALEIVGHREQGPPWLALTLVLGVGFLAGQALAWRQLVSQGIYVSGNPSSAFFYLLTGTHAVHLTGGLIALLYAGIISLRGRPVEKRFLAVDITAWYWHFMAVLWVYILLLMQLAK